MSMLDRELIPPPPVVRAELARSVREARRLRALLRVALQAEKDRQELARLAAHEARQRPRGTEAAQ